MTTEPTMRTEPIVKTAPPGIGLIIIGSEILDGRRHDAHFLFCRDLLRERRLPLVYVLVLKDEPALITAQLRWCWSRPEPFLCCGGIGATPDDHTRGCAAEAAGVPLAFHPEGERILAARWGAGLTENRRRLIEFPAGATLIPNPVNQVPGFSLHDGHFVPGFPEMARPMITWALDAYYLDGAETARHTLLLPGARESDVSPIMEDIVRRFPDLSLSSLPRFTGKGTGTEVELSLHGPRDRVAEGFAALQASLDAAGFRHDACP